MNTRNQRGVSLVELMVAMVLMAVALLALAASIPYSLYGIVAAGVQTTATLLAQEAIERAQSADYASLPSLSFDGSSAPLPADCGAGLRPVTAFAGFRRCVAVESGVPTPTSTTITAVVEFVGAGPGAVHRTALVTVRSN